MPLITKSARVVSLVAILGLISAFALLVPAAGPGLWPAGRALAAPNARDCSGGNAIILSPGSGSVVFGLVQVEGTASLGGEFQYYKLEVAPAGTDAWGGLGGEVRQQVVNGQLGVWDSAAAPDGSYTFRLRVVDPTGNYCEALVTNVRVQNGAPPSPTQPAEPSATPTPAETEAPPIQNAVPTPITPAAGSTGNLTPTPARTATAVTNGDSTDAPEPGLNLGIDLGGIVDAAREWVTALTRTFLFGVLAMGAIFFLIGVIFFVRRVL